MIVLGRGESGGLGRALPPSVGKLDTLQSFSWPSSLDKVRIVCQRAVMPGMLSAGSPCVRDCPSHFYFASPAAVWICFNTPTLPELWSEITDTISLLRAILVPDTRIKQLILPHPLPPSAPVGYSEYSSMFHLANMTSLSKWADTWTWTNTHIGLMIHSLSQTSVQLHPSPAPLSDRSQLSGDVSSRLRKDKNEIFFSSSIFHYI